MKKQLLTACVALCSFAANAQFWTNQNVPLLYDGYINDMEVVSSNVAWGNTWNALATTPYTQDFAKTIDGGLTWITGSIAAPAALSISNIWPIDADTCYVSMWSSPGGAIYKTTDGGGTWNQVGANMFTQPTSFANVVYFFDAANGFAMGDPSGSPLRYELYQTSNYGVTWTQVPSANIPPLTNNAEFGITNLFSAAQGRVWFGTTYGDVYRSIDGGTTWTKSASGFPAYNGTNGRQDISDIAFSDSLNGIITQTNATTTLVRKTSDGGLTWTAITPAGSFFTSDIDGVPNTTYFVSAGSNATGGFGTSFSNDGGLTWTVLDTLFSHTALDFADASTGFGGEFITGGSASGGAWKFTGTLTSGPLNDECNNATDITTMFGQTPNVVITTGPYDNTLATTGSQDPLTGFACFGEPDGLGGAPELNNTLWFTFVGDGGLYFIEAPNTCAGVTNPLIDGDSQIAIYTGTCGNWTDVACNEDGPNAVNGYYPAGLNLQTTAGTSYLMIVDGFNLNGTTLSTGEFCLNVTNLTSLACGNSQLSSGISTPNGINICADSLFSLTTDSIVAPNVAPLNGFSIIVSSNDITGSVPPFTGLLGGTGTINVGVNGSQVVNLVNDGAIFAPGVYYFTPVVYGNATGTGNITALTLDPGCTYLGSSVMVNLLAPGDPLCFTGINDANNINLSASVSYNNDNFMVNINSDRAANANISIVDVTGRLISSEKINIISGQNTKVFNASILSTGSYLIKIETAFGSTVTKLIKM